MAKVHAENSLHSLQIPDDKWIDNTSWWPPVGGGELTLQENPPERN